MTRPRYAALLADARAELAAWAARQADTVKRSTRSRKRDAATVALCSCGCGRPRWNRTRFAESCYFRVRRDGLCRVCGRAATAKRLCSTHYTNEWRKRQRRARGMKYVRGQSNVRCNHFDRPHHAHGRCKTCDQRVRRGRLPSDGGSTGVVQYPPPAHAA